MINEEFRKKIMKKFIGVSGKKNSVDGMSPVFFTKDLNS